MIQETDAIDGDDAFDLRRFIDAQDGVYDRVLEELRDGRKRTHWMWFIFPQLEGLGYSPTAQYYAIKSVEEARQYLSHPLLGARLRECADALLSLVGRSASEILGYPDDLKLKSSMTLFSWAAESPSVFKRVPECHFDGELDTRTLELLERLRGGNESGI